MNQRRLLEEILSRVFFGFFFKVQMLSSVLMGFFFFKWLESFEPIQDEQYTISTLARKTSLCSVQAELFEKLEFAFVNRQSEH